MSRNRILGTPQSTNTLPATAGSFYDESFQDDVLVPPANAAAGTPYCTLRLNGCGGAATAGAQPADGDQLDISDALGVLGPGTTLIIQGRSGGVGFPIADGSTPVDSVTLNTAGARRSYVFSGPLSAWVSVI